MTFFEVQPDVLTSQAPVIGGQANAPGAIGDAQEAARQAAIKLNAAADAFDPPLPPANSEVAPFESNWQWARRQLGDLFYDPFAFWDPEGNGQAGWYQRGRMVFDIKTAYLGGLIWALYEQRHSLFRVRDPRGGLWVPGGTRRGPGTGLPLVGSSPLGGRDWVQRRSPVTVPNVATAGRLTTINSVANRAGGALAFGTAALDQFMADRNRPDLDGGDRTARAAGASVVVGGASVVGGIAGMKAGAAIGAGIGSLFGPGPGTAVGAVVGGAIGGIVGSGVGQALGNKAKDLAFNLLPDLFS